VIQSTDERVFGAVTPMFPIARSGRLRTVQSFPRIFPLLLCLFAGAAPQAGCRKSGQAEGEAIKKTLASYQPQFAELKRRYMDLRERVDSIPMDTPEFPEARAHFYAAEEARGITEARIASLSERVNAAMSAGNREELQEISKEVAAVPVDIQKVDELHTKMLHQMMRFERNAQTLKEASAAAAANPPPPPAAKTKRTKANP
jgi:hypothetical protein